MRETTKARLATDVLAWVLEQIARKNITVDEAIRLLEAIRDTGLTEVEREEIEARR